MPRLPAAAVLAALAFALSACHPKSPSDPLAEADADAKVHAIIGATKAPIAAAPAPAPRSPGAMGALPAGGK